AIRSVATMATRPTVPCFLFPMSDDGDEQGVALDPLARADVDFADGAVAWCSDLVVHLHRLDHDQHLPLHDRLAGLHRDILDDAGERRLQRRWSADAAERFGAATARSLDLDLEH